MAQFSGSDTGIGIMAEDYGFKSEYGMGTTFMFAIPLNAYHHNLLIRRIHLGDRVGANTLLDAWASEHVAFLPSNPFNRKSSKPGNGINHNLIFRGKDLTGIIEMQSHNTI